MKHKRLNFYFFGEPGDYDHYNPGYVCNREYAPEILYLIALNEPFSIGSAEIAKSLNISLEKMDDIINNLQLIQAIEVKNRTFRINFPIFLEEDVIKMETFLSNIGQVIGDRIISLADIINSKLLKLECSNQHSKERIRYHVICDQIFDGTAFDFFTEKNIFSSSKLQPGNRDYVIIAYEDSKTVEAHSNKLLCSSNNFQASGVVFNSFGDSNGSRKDMYRFFKLLQKGIDGASPFKELNKAYSKVLDDRNKEIAIKSAELISRIASENVPYTQLIEEEKNLIYFLKELNYIHIDEVNNSIIIKIPVFYESETSIIEETSHLILSEIVPVLREFFVKFQMDASDLTSMKHKVDINELANELWHQIFGATNEYLVENGFVALPDNIEGEGRYFRSLTINSQKRFSNNRK